MLAFGTLSIVLTRDRVAIAATVAALLAIGALYIVFRVPTRERVLGQAALAQEAANRS